MNIDGENPSFFITMVDELIDFSESDPELKAGLQWIDEESKKRGISFYEMVYHVLHRYDVNLKANEWNNNRN